MKNTLITQTVSYFTKTVLQGIEGFNSMIQGTIDSSMYLFVKIILPFCFYRNFVQFIGLIKLECLFRSECLV